MSRPFHAHDLDPVALYDMASDVGQAMIKGEVSPDTARAWVSKTAEANAQNPDHRSGLQARLSWALRDAADGYGLKIRETERTIKRAIVPLLERGEPKNVILAELHEINGQAGFPLSEQQVNDIAAAAVRWFLKDRRFG